MFTMRPARVLMVWVLLGLPASVVAQETTRVTGVVIDGADAATGMPLAGARVESGVEVVATGGGLAGWFLESLKSYIFCKIFKKSY